MAERKPRSADPASLAMLEVAERIGVATAWDRLEAQKVQCRFGREGLCCRHCFMGPCRVGNDGRGPQVGVCGATADTVVARSLLRHITAGTAAHSDHGREIVRTLHLAAEGTSPTYRIRGPAKLRALADEYGIPREGRCDEDVARDLAAFLFAQFGQQEGELADLGRAPSQQRKNWQQAEVAPRGIDREVTTALHMTAMGVDSDPEHLLLAAARVALANGWGGSMIASDVSDVLFGEPQPLRARVNLGVLKEDEVNILVHGHEPTLSDVMVAASRDPKLLAEAEAAGARGINLAGICCTANEVLMRHGVPIAGNFLQQELALTTGAVDVMLVDVQCVFPSLSAFQQCFHTRVISTSGKARFPDVQHIPFDEESAWEAAGEIVREAVAAFRERDPAKVQIPSREQPLVAGFTREVISTILGGRYRPSYRPLNDAIKAGRIRGVAGVVGCNNPKFTQDASHLAMVRELIRNDVLVVQTGCSAIACGKAGLMTPEAAAGEAGEGLREVCAAVGIPPVLHCGSCVDNTRILAACAEMVAEGGIGDSFDQLPVAGAAPEWMSEKAIAIGMYFVASGISVVIGQPLPVEGSDAVVEFLTRTSEEHFGATWSFEPDAVQAARRMIDLIDGKRAALGLPAPMYAVPYAPQEAEPVAVAE